MLKGLKVTCQRQQQLLCSCRMPHALLVTRRANISAFLFIANCRAVMFYFLLQFCFITFCIVLFFPLSFVPVYFPLRKSQVSSRCALHASPAPTQPCSQRQRPKLLPFSSSSSCTRMGAALFLSCRLATLPSWRCGQKKKLRRHFMGQRKMTTMVSLERRKPLLCKSALYYTTTKMIAIKAPHGKRSNTTRDAHSQK